MQVLNVQKNSIADKLGFKKGDKIISMGGHPLEDILDFLHYEHEHNTEVEFKSKDGMVKKITIKNPNYLPLGIELDGDGIVHKHCGNKCMFCFVDQLPTDPSLSLRQTLRFKDDDYRLSFSNGTYITLTNLKLNDLERIKRLKLSPLYVSVHSTDPILRAKLLGHKTPKPILPVLKELKEAGIDIHAQIVYCPDINEDLEKSASDLRNVCASLAIVPVGLTAFKNPALRAVTADDAKRVLKLLGRLQCDSLGQLGTRFVWAADEFYVLAGQKVPIANTDDFYENYDQIENGVGLFSQFDEGFDYALDDYRGTKAAKLAKDKRLTIVTGESAYDFMCAKAVAVNTALNTKLQVLKVKNNFFGGAVSVVGLLSGGDILAALSEYKKQNSLGEAVLIPRCCLKEFDTQFLDNMTLDELQASIGMSVIAVEVDGEAFVQAVLTS